MGRPNGLLAIRLKTKLHLFQRNNLLLFSELNFRLFSYNLNYLNCLINELIGNGKGYAIALVLGWLFIAFQTNLRFNQRSHKTNSLSLSRSFVIP